MDDLISRQAAIDAIEFGIRYVKAFNKITGEIKELFQKENDELREAVERVKQLPSIQSEQKTGRWLPIPDPYDFFDTIPVCSECGCTTPMRTKTPFCPHCGADMREEGGNVETLD